jgi:hypothetical protein
MPSWPQWMSITFLIARMCHIRILLPLKILGNLVVLALPQIFTHTIWGDVVDSYYSRASRNGSTPPSPPCPYNLSSLTNLYPHEPGGAGPGQGVFHTSVAEATCSVSLTPSLPSASHSTSSPAPDGGFLAEDVPPPTQNANFACNISNDETISPSRQPIRLSASRTRTVVCACMCWSSSRRPSRTSRVPSG